MIILIALDMEDFIMKAFEYDSGFMKFATLLSRVTLLNLLWMVCCLPVITAGAATIAQYYATNRLIAGDMHVFQNFKEGFRLHWKRATVVWVILAILSAVFFMDYRIVTTTDIPGKTALIVISVLAFITLVMGMLWIYPVMINFTGTMKEILFNAFVFAFMYAPVTLIAAGFYALTGFLFVKFLIARGLVFLFGQGMIVYAILNLYEKVFQKYRNKEN